MLHLVPAEPEIPMCVRTPTRPGARSLSLANSVAIIAYEALRQPDFPGPSGEGEMKGDLP